MFLLFFLKILVSLFLHLLFSATTTSSHVLLLSLKFIFIDCYTRISCEQCKCSGIFKTEAFLMYFSPSTLIIIYCHLHLRISFNAFFRSLRQRHCSKRHQVRVLPRESLMHGNFHKVR